MKKIYYYFTQKFSNSLRIRESISRNIFRVILSIYIYVGIICISVIVDAIIITIIAFNVLDDIAYPIIPLL